MPQFGEMNANLMCATRFQSTLHQGISADCFKRLHVRDRQLAEVRVLRAAAAAVAPIAHQPAGNRLRLHLAFDDRQVAPMRRMLPEFLGQYSLGGVRPGKHYESAGIPIDTVHSPHGHGDAPAIAAASDLRDHMWQQFIERGLNLLAPLRPLPFLPMPIRRHTGRLFDDDHVVIEILYADIVFFRRRCSGMGQHFDHVVGRQPSAGIGAQIAADHYPP